MKRKAAQILEKIERYSRQTRSFVAGYTYADFMQDNKAVAACVFNLSQIGELIKIVDNSLKERYSTIPWHQLRGLRNRIVHDYEGIQLYDVWDVIQHGLPRIECELRMIRRKEAQE